MRIPKRCAGYLSVAEGLVCWTFALALVYVNFVIAFSMGEYEKFT